MYLRNTITNFQIKIYKHLSKRDILSMLKFDDILLPVNNFKASIRVKLPNVASIEPTHAPFINL